MAYITANNLLVGYDKRGICGPVSFTVKEKDYLYIVGENGAGKTTLMKTILGLIPQVSGEILWGDGLHKGEVGYLPQQTVVQKDFPATVREIVLSGCLRQCGFRPFYTRKQKKTADENMEKLGITDLSRSSYRELSGGQQQRVLLARALCATGKVILLDEPISGLDPKVTAEMYELIRRLNEEGVTVIMISHDIEAAAGYASHILHLGDTIFYGTRQEYLSSNEGRIFLTGQKTGGAL